MTTYQRHPLDKSKPAPHVRKARRMQRTGLRPSDIHQVYQAVARLVTMVGKFAGDMSDALGRVVRSLAPPATRSDFALMPPRAVTRTRYTPPTN